VPLAEYGEPLALVHFRKHTVEVDQHFDHYPKSIVTIAVDLGQRLLNCVL
jgi:hypothetical protein